MAQVFISYKRKDSSISFVQHLKQKLEAEAFDVWIDHELLRPGQDWKKEIDNAIKASLALIVVMTPEAHESKYVTYEWAFAIGRGMEVIPLLLENTELHPRLNDLQFIDFTNHWALPWEKLIDRLREIEVGQLSKARERPAYVQRAVDALDSYELADRITAIDSLTQSNHLAALEALADAVNHHIDDVRIYAARKLAITTDYKDERAVSGLIEGIHSDNHKEIVISLARIGSPTACLSLLQALSFPQGRWRLRETLEAFSVMENPAVLSLLVDAVESPEDVICLAAIEALGSIKDEVAVSPLIEILKSNRGQVIDPYEKHATIGDIKISASYALGKIASPDALPILTTITKNAKDDRVRKAAVVALSMIHHPKVMPALIVVAQEDTTPSIRADAILALGQLKDATSVQHLVALLSDTTEFSKGDPYPGWVTTRICDVVAKVLREMGTSEALEALNEWEAKKSAPPSDLNDIPF